MEQKEKKSGRPSNGSEKLLRRKKRRRGRRGLRRERKYRRSSKIIKSTLTMMMLLFHMDVAAAKAIPWKDLQTPIEKANYWAVTPDLPVFQLITWRHQAIPLVTKGNGSFFEGPWTGPEGQRVEKTFANLTFSTNAIPLCLSVNLHVTHCMKLDNHVIVQHSHSATDLNNITVQLAVKMLAIPHDSYTPTKEKGSALPPCPSSTFSPLFSPFQSCSTGILQHPDKPVGLNISFWDGGRNGTSALVAPTPIGEGIVQWHLWKIGAAISPLHVSTLLTAPPNKLPAQIIQKEQWKWVFEKKNRTCNNHPRFNQDVMCFDFQVRTYTVGNAAFLLCNSTFIHKSQDQYQERWTVVCSGARITNVIHKESIQRGTIFLLRIPPILSTQ
ncbi:uncharacterized protein LOC141509653 [Macrotis lagotis]|uniref:uncharacterized protein LOC141509653 n=1 Tax=Macrotis lagotis TaxID=92651 RepID=UPI003D69BC1E